MIKAENLRVSKGKNVILNIDNLEIEEPKNVGIFGPNGAGKTTLVKCIMEAENYTGILRLEAERNKIQVLMQKNAYPPYAKVKDIIKLVLNIKDLASVQSIINYFDFEKCINKTISILSGGELQKLNLILVLSVPHELLIVDEVTTGLDYETRKDLIRYLKKHLEDNQCKLLIISHYPEELSQLTDMIICLQEGEIKEICSTKDFMEQYGKMLKNEVNENE